MIEVKSHPGTFIVGFLFLLVPVPLDAQSSGVTFNHLSERDGMAGREVHCILQDSRGFLWFGTENGLNRYDGYGFTVYKHEPGNAASIVDAKIQSLWEDKQGDLWVGTWRGLDRFDRASNSFSHFLPDPQPQGDAPRNVIYSIRQDRNGTLWLGTLDGLDTLDRVTGKFTCFRHDSSNPGSLVAPGVDAIYEDKTGMLWLGTQGGLDRYDPGSKSFVHYWRMDRTASAGDPIAFSSNHWIQTIYEDRNGILWLGTNGGPVAFDRTKDSFRPYSIMTAASDTLQNRSVSSVLEDESGTLWIGTWGDGLMTYDVQAEGFVPHHYEKLDPAAENNSSICTMYLDRSGSIWIGTNGEGISRVVKTDTRFTSFTHITGDKIGLSNNDIRFMYQHNPGETVSIGTSLGIDHFDRRTGAFFDPAAWERPYPITGLLPSRSGLVTYTGIQGDGFNVIRDHPYRRKYFSTGQYGLGGSACSLFEDRRGLVWMLFSDVGLCQFDPQTEKFTNLNISKAQKFVSGRLIVEEQVDPGAPDGWVLWIGTSDGLWRYDARANAFTRFGFDPKDPRSLSSNSVNTVFRDREGRLWIGTDRGLNRMDSTAGRFACFTEDNGLPDNLVLGILEDDHGRIWVSTSKSVSRFDSRIGRFSSYGMKDVLPGIRFGAGCCVRSSNGEMYFGGTGGFILFHPDSIRENSYVPPVVISGFRRFDIPAALDSALAEKKVIELSYKDNDFSFDFAALNFTKSEANQYAYRLEGYDSAWIYCGNRQFARYINVGAGRYTFRVKGSNNDGVWNEAGTSVALIIAPPFWRTWWAYALYGISLVTMLYAFRRYEMNRQQLKYGYELKKIESDKLKELDGLKSRFFANISHEFRTPLTLILGPTEELQAVLPDEASREKLFMVHRNAQRLLRLINQLLDLSKIDAGGMKLQAAPGNIVPFVKGIAQSFHSSAGKKSVALEVSAEEDEIELYFDQDKMEKILTNILSNAFKFTPEGGRVTVRVTLSQPGTFIANGPVQAEFPKPFPSGSVEIIIEDTGIGIPEGEIPHIFDRFYQVDASQTREQEGTGIGLALTKELVELHCGIISVKSEVGKGTEFNVRFPLGVAHLQPDEIIIPQAGAGERTSARLEAPMEPVRSDGAALAPDGTYPIILVVEDNSDVRAYIRGYLSPAYRVLDAADGVEGVKIAGETIPDMIISDVMMPKMDGNELCRRLKGDEKTSHIPIILLTAKAGQENKIEGLETGADDYLTKPFDAKELLVRVKNLIDLRRKLRERFSAGQVLKPGEIAVTSIDDAFLKKVMGIVEKRLGEETFSVEDLAGESGMSRSQLHRKLTALTGQSPSDFIRYMRLHRAMELLKKNAGTVSEIAYTVGFSGVSYFTKCFREQFGTLPSEEKRVD